MPVNVKDSKPLLFYSEVFIFSWFHTLFEMKEQKEKWLVQLIITWISENFNTLDRVLEKGVEETLKVTGAWQMIVMTK